MLGYKKKLFSPSEFRQRGYVYMPNYIRKVKGGYKVFSKAGKPLSKKPKTYKAALKQLGAVEASKARRAKNPLSENEFIDMLDEAYSQYKRAMANYRHGIEYNEWRFFVDAHENIASAHETLMLAATYTPPNKVEKHKERMDALKKQVLALLVKIRNVTREAKTPLPEAISEEGFVWNPRKKKLGRCFELSAKLLLDFGRQGISDARLVHGRVINTKTGKPMLHGWVEIEDVVFDPEADAVLRKERYYQIGQVDVPSLKKYTAEEAAIQMLKTKHFGPWELELSNPVHWLDVAEMAVFDKAKRPSGEDISFIYSEEDWASNIIKPGFSDKQPYQMTYQEFSDFCAKNDYWCYGERSPLYFSVPILRDPQYTYDVPGEVVGIRTKKTWRPSHTDIIQLKASMAEKGLEEPVCLDFLWRDRIAVIDGTHRIWMAFELGWKKIAFYLTPKSVKSNRMGDAHRFFIMLALKEGRKVPRKVLEQYYKSKKGDWWEQKW